MITAGARWSPPVQMTRARDVQRKQVYDWERTITGFVDVGEMSLTDSITLIKRVWRDYGYGHPMPRVSDGRSRRNASGSCMEIKLPRWARSTHIVLHETAHAVLDAHDHVLWRRMAGAHQLSAWHGPQFVRLYAELLVVYAGVDPAEIHATIEAAPRRIAMARSDELPWRAHNIVRRPNIITDPRRLA